MLLNQEQISNILGTNTNDIWDVPASRQEVEIEQMERDLEISDCIKNLLNAYLIVDREDFYKLPYNNKLIDSQLYKLERDGYTVTTNGKTYVLIIE